jgi:hypothetical protein
MLYSRLAKYEIDALPLFRIEGGFMDGREVSSDEFMAELERRASEDDSTRIQDFCAQAKVCSDIHNLIVQFLTEIMRARKSVCFLEPSGKYDLQFFGNGNKVFVFPERVNNVARQGITSLFFDDRPTLGTFAKTLESIQSLWDRFDGSKFELVDIDDRKPVSVAFGKISVDDDPYICEASFKTRWLGFPPKERRGRGAGSFRVHPLVPLRWLRAPRAGELDLELTELCVNRVFGGSNKRTHQPTLDKMEFITREQFLGIFAQAFMSRTDVDFCENVSEIIRSS